MMADSLLRRARLRARRLGFDVSRYPQESSDYAAMRAFLSDAPDVVLDVGAHTGEFVAQCRALGYQGPAVSFEPEVRAFSRLRTRAQPDPDWSVIRAAVGDRHGTAELQVAGNDGASSSLLPMLPLHREALPESRYVASQTVGVIRLDTFLGDYPQWSRLAVKIDVQGFERAVLEGLGARLSDVRSLRLELSMQPLYEGAWLWLEASEWLTGQGLVLVGVIPGFRDPVTGRQLQFDAVFARP